MPTPQQLNMGTVTTGLYLFAKTDRPILIALDDPAKLWPLGTNDDNGGMIFVGEFTAVYLQNTNPDYNATVDIVVAGE